MRYLIVGASAAAISAVHTIARSTTNASFTILAEQREHPNNTCAIKHVLSGIWPKERVFLPLPAQVKLMLGQTVTGIDPVNRLVFTRAGQQYEYDKLIVASGTRPRTPAFPAQGIFTYHNLDDVDDIIAYLATHSVAKIVVVGAGLSGIEAALACRQRGLKVWLFERQLVVAPQEDHETQERLGAMLHEQGVVVECGREVAFVRQDNGFLLNLEDTDTGGIPVKVEMVLLALGGEPTTDFLKGVCQLDQDGYVVDVDKHYKDSIKVIGDCLARQRIRNGWARAIEDGKKAGGERR